MNPSLLKEGQIITCKEGYYLGIFSSDSLSDFSAPYIPWLAISSFDLTHHSSIIKNGEWIYGAGEILVYLGCKNSQLELSFDKIDSEMGTRHRKCLQYHEVLWRGCVYKVKNSNFRQLKRMTVSSNKKDKKIK